MNRRNFLKIAGSTAVIVAASGAVFVATRTPAKALKPWQDAGSIYTDPMRRALSYAILAPNPHNRQPWVVDLKSDSEAVLTCDLDRSLPVTDPFSRQIVIGLGCFLETLSIAAAEQGYVADISYFPQGETADRLDQRPIAHIRLRKNEMLAPDPLFAEILRRHTNRNTYDTARPIVDATVKRLQGVAGGPVRIGVTNGGAELEFLRTLSRDAMLVEMKTPEAYQETIDLMRIGKAEIETNPDGISLGGAFLETLSLIGILSRESLADPSSKSFQIGLDMVEQGAMTSMGFVWINTKGNDRPAQIEAGRAYMRIALQATADELAIQPMSQALQEYPEMAPYYKLVHENLTEQSGETVQMLIRIGYSEAIGPTPRWGLDTKIKKN